MHPHKAQGKEMVNSSSLAVEFLQNEMGKKQTVIHWKWEHCQKEAVMSIKGVVV